jgi:hypothetical protein
MLRIGGTASPLGNRYGRSFANHWEFVRFAKEQHHDLDFTTPPKRPVREGVDPAARMVN